MTSASRLAKHSDHAGPLRRFKPYPEYRASGVEWLGEIPAHWGLKRLKRVVAFRGGGTPSKDNLEYWRGEIPWVSPKDMKVSIIEETEDKISAEAVRESPTKLVPAGAVLIVVRSGILVHSVPVSIAAREVTLNQDLKALMPGSEIFGPYLMYLISGMQRELLIEWKKEGATVESLELDLIADTPTPLPDAAEQRAIAAFLDRETARIDALVAKKERLIELLQEQRTALITRAVTKGLDPSVPMKESGVEWLGQIPAHWEVRRLKTIAAVQLSNVDKKSVQGQEPVRLCNYTDVYYNERITADLDFMIATATSEQVRRFSLLKHDVLITKDSESWTDIAVPAVVAEDLPGVLCGYHLAHIRSAGDCYGPFLARAFGAVGPREQYRVAANGITRFGLGGDAIAGGLFAMPPQPEQRAIAIFLDRETARVDTLIATVRDAIARLKELRTSVISAAVTGKIDVREEAA